MIYLVSTESQMFHCSSEEIALRVKYRQIAEGHDAEITTRHSIMTDYDEDLLVFDLGGVVFADHPKETIDLITGTRIQFSPNDWTSFKHDVKEAIRINDDFAILECRWWTLVVSKQEIKEILSVIDRNAKRYSKNETDIFERYEMANRLLMLHSNIAERAITKEDIQ